MEHEEQIRARLARLWPSLEGLRVLCAGPLPPGFVPGAFAAHPTPVPDQGRVFAASPDALPLEAASVDRAVVAAPRDLSEVWRVLRPHGRAVVIVRANPRRVRAQLMRAKLAPVRIVAIGPLGWLWPCCWLIEVQKRIFGRTPPGGGLRFRVPQILPGRQVVPSPLKNLR